MTISIGNLTASYPHAAETPALQGLTLDIRSGRRLVLLGENGSGKTTLLRVLAGVMPYEGSVRIDGTELSSMKREEISSRIALLTQLHGTYFSYTVRETVSHGRYLRRKHAGLFAAAPEEEKKAVERVLERTGLSDIADRAIDTLSGGQMQRVFLARALAQETPVLLLDEPTNHLDLRFQEALTTDLIRWSEEETPLPSGSRAKNTLIGVFHDLPLALHIAEDVALLKEGRLLWSGTREELLQQPKLLKEAFSLDALAWLRSLAV
ncbi:MAG: ABC transporter ATP-binding protein [Lachnospiraceae bacterium]|nr:ABC transporter ATP-binding protein [Lachnospiraceae bacterium]